MVRVLLADDDAMSVLGMRQVLLAEPDLQVVGEARSAHDLVAVTRSLRPDVVVLARSLGGEPVVFSLAAVLVVGTDQEVWGDPLEPLWAGAAGLLLKAGLVARLAPAVRDLAAGGVVLDPSLARTAVERLRDGAAPPEPRVLARLAELTAREREVLRRIADASNRDIAEALGISPLTVKAHVRRILAKLGVADRRTAGRTARYLDDELGARRAMRPVRNTASEA